MVFVGRRRRAFEAASALGLDVVCVAPAPPERRSPALVHYLPCRLEEPGEDLAEIARQLTAGWDVRAVFALTEAAVVPAAWLRRHLGVAGDSLGVARRATDKVEMKEAISRAGIPCARYASAASGLGPEELIERLGLPMVIKNRVGSGGRGARVVLRRGELDGPLEAGRIAESFVDGVEMSVESLVWRGRPAFTNATEYYRVRWANIVPAALPADTLDAVLELNARAIAALGAGVAFTHMELFLTAGGPVFSELAVRPPGGHVSDLIELAYGFDPWQAWLRMGLGEEPPASATPVRAAGVWLLHPGAGVVRSVAGSGAVRAAPGVERLRLRLRPGQTVAERAGSGQEVGHILVTGRDRDQVAARLEHAHRLLRIEMEEVA